METYIVRVNGVEYEVEIEKAGAAKGRNDRVPEAKAEQAPKPAAKRSGKAEGEPCVCGTAGKVYKVVAREGDTVKSGDTIIILEAMKMEIPVVAPKDGTISKIVVSEGDSTASGQPVAYIA